MSRSLGVADSKCDIDEGTITGITLLKTASSATIGFYGATPVVQRATATSHTTTNCVTSTAFGTQQQAIVQEIMNTLIACGLWAA